MDGNSDDKGQEENNQKDNISQTETQYRWNTSTIQIFKTIDMVFSYYGKRPAYKSPEQIQIQQEQQLNQLL